MREVAVLGVGQTKFGELWDRSFREIGIEAGLQALVDAKLSSGDLGGLFLGNMASGALIDQEHIAPLILDATGLGHRHLPAVRVEGGGASGALALHQGYLAVASGLYDFVVVGGAEKLTDVPDEVASRITSSAADQEWEVVFGATLPALWALVARRHMHDFGTTREELANVAVHAHAMGSKNPNAHFRNKLTVEQVVQAGPVAEPLGVLDCAPLSDGAAAVVLGPMELARQHTDTPIRIAASQIACDTMALQQRAEITRLDSTVVAAQRAFEQARRAPADVQVAEVHDAYTISALVSLEGLGFVEKGRSGPEFATGRFGPGGKTVVNTSGGLKAQGRPFGAVGVAQVVELVRQLRGEAKERQVPGATLGLAQDVGGTGATTVVHLLERTN
ncbi:MAG TPA: thiolase domain-containing protein [Thermoplasmata archaeon]|jgi:acetyl-CoA C-acetyltransferase|nr:thiolase domain-containing protein [Thermoplasmata archaeon]